MRMHSKEIQPRALGAIEAWERTLSIRTRLGLVTAVLCAVTGAAFLAGYVLTVVRNLLGVG